MANNFDVFMKNSDEKDFTFIGKTVGKLEFEKLSKVDYYTITLKSKTKKSMAKARSFIFSQKGIEIISFSQDFEKLETYITIKE